MKSRSGFVSNSSSSSFIIGFDTKPKSAAELRKLLFDGMEFVQYYDKSYSTVEISERIFNDLKGERPASLSTIIETVRSGHFPGYPETWRKDKESDKLERQFNEMFPEYKGNYWDETKITRPMARQLTEKIRVARRKEIDEDNKTIENAATDFVNERVKPRMGDKKVYVLEYGDENGDLDGAIEHSGVLQNVAISQISHH